MSENEPANQAERQFGVQRIYVKDVSFEAPGAPNIFKANFKPDINVNMGSQVDELGDDHYELVLTVTVTAMHEESTAFVVEVQQAGIFVIKGMTKEEMGPLMGIHCPTVLFPYARETISDLITRGTFPQFLLAPVNFEGMYRQQLQQRQEQSEASH